MDREREKEKDLRFRTGVRVMPMVVISGMIWWILEKIPKSTPSTTMGTYHQQENPLIKNTTHFLSDTK